MDFISSYEVKCDWQNHLKSVHKKTLSVKGPFIPEIYYAIAISITIRCKNGLCTEIYDNDCDYYSTHRKESQSQSRNKSQVWINHKGTKEDAFFLHS